MNATNVRRARIQWVVAVLATLQVVTLAGVSTATQPPEDKPSSATQPAGGEPASGGSSKGKNVATAEEVPRLIHFFWAGKLDSNQPELNNIVAWGNAAKKGAPKQGDPYKVTLWTTDGTTIDPEARKRLKQAGVDIETDVASEFSKLHFDADINQTMQVRDAQNQPVEVAFSGATAAELYGNLVTMGAYAAASDVARYAILQNHGGIYVDADMAPGKVDLSKPPPKMATTDIPFFGPALRDGSDWKKAKKARPGLAKLGGDKATVAQLYKDGINNNLIIAPKNSTFIQELNVTVQTNLVRLDNNAKFVRKDPRGRFVPGQPFGTEQTANKTGPLVIAAAIENRISPNVKLAKEENARRVGDAASLLNPNADPASKNFANVQLFTDASSSDAASRASTSQPAPDDKSKPSITRWFPKKGSSSKSTDNQDTTDSRGKGPDHDPGDSRSRGKGPDDSSASKDASEGCK